MTDRLTTLKSQWYDIFMEAQKLQVISEHLNREISALQAKSELKQESPAENPMESAPVILPLESANEDKNET